MKIKTLSEYHLEGKVSDILFWVGCAGSFDDRAKEITRSFAKILIYYGVKLSILGIEESCTGDPAKRSGNDFLYQMQAINNIKKLNYYNVKKIITICPHCLNTIKNEYPDLGGVYEVYHHTEFLENLLKNEDKLNIEDNFFHNKKMTFHDPCYLGRINKQYNAPRSLLNKLITENFKFSEMKRCKSQGLCCGAGGAQFFKETEQGNKEINIERLEEVESIDANLIVTGCPFCNIMLNDGIKMQNKEDKIVVKDIAELIIKAKKI